MAQPPKYFAHSLTGQPQTEWQDLEEHLRQTGDLAEAFSQTFAPGWGELAGLWHDVGKYQPAFQQMIRRDPEAHVKDKVDHSSVGAIIASSNNAGPLAFAIAGHHGGLPNFEPLRARLAAKQQLLADAQLGGLPPSILDHPVPIKPPWLDPSDAAQLSLWTRFVFSALVDADFLDTERFYARGTERDLGPRPTIPELKARLDHYLSGKTIAADPTPINQMRARILDACRRNALSDSGAFTLTVPTGGGKTLASLSFALDHAVKHNLRRVIVVIPFTSIIEQSANVYREALGDEFVLEHHTNVDPDQETPANRLACENWDAPIVVTTSVQFFESLFANRPSRCRKLHRIARSVVVFDEVQTFPPKLLLAVKHILSELPRNYGSTTLLCTATQPALSPTAREVIPNPSAEFAVVQDRCQFLMPTGDEPTTWDRLATDLKAHKRVMAIVHRRDDAQTLAELVGDDCLHLSARMCPRHRTRVLATVKKRLQDGSPCRLVATQLVEAGVDVDFPEVYRAFAGADSLAQAAGRCNREGKGTGRLHVFIAPTRPPAGILRTAAEATWTIWKGGRLDLRQPSTFTEFFNRLYERSELDPKGVMALERGLNFEDSAAAFRMIDEIGQPVVAPYEDWQDRVEEIRKFGISRLRMRRLQHLMVTLYPQEIATLQTAGAIERIADTFWAPVPAFPIYSDRWGFGWRGGLSPEPVDLIA